MSTHIFDSLNPSHLNGIKRRLLSNPNADGNRVQEFASTNEDSKKESFEDVTCLEIISHLIDKPNIPFKYKHVDSNKPEDQTSRSTDTAKRHLFSPYSSALDIDRFNFTSLAIMNRFLYKLTNTPCTCNLQAIAIKHTNKPSALSSPLIKILCPIHSGYPIHETMRTTITSDKPSLFGKPQPSLNILHTHSPEGIFVVKEMGLACKYGFISQKNLHVLHVLSLLSPTNHLSMFKLSSPLLSVGYVYLNNLYVTHGMVDGSVYNGPALFIATKNEFRIAKLADSLGITKKVNNKTQILNMQLVLRQKNPGIKVGRILSHKPTGKIFMLDQLNGVYEFVYQKAKVSYKTVFFDKPLKACVESFFTIYKHVNSFIGFSDGVVKYTVNPVEVNVIRSTVEKPKSFVNCSCLKEQLDVSIKEPSLYYPPLLWEALSFDDFSLPHEYIGGNVCTCGGPMPCSVLPVDYSTESLNSWYSSQSIRSNSTIIDGFIDNVKNILAILFLNGDLIVYSIPLFTLGSGKSGYDGFLLRGDIIQHKLLTMHYNRHVGCLVQFNKENKKFCTISPASRADELAANNQNVLVVLSDEFGSRIYIGLEPIPSRRAAHAKKQENDLVNYDNLKFSNNYNLTIKGYRLLPPYHSPEGHLSNNPEHRSLSISENQQSFYKSFSVDSNTYVTVQVALRSMVQRAGLQHLIPTRPISATGAGSPTVSMPPTTSSFTFNPLTAGPLIPDATHAGPHMPINKPATTQKTSVGNTLYKITISVSDTDTYGELDNEHQSVSRSLWNSIYNIPKPEFKLSSLKHVEWYDQFYIYLSEGEKLVSVFLYGESPGRLIVTTTYHVYNIERQTQYSLLNLSIHSPIRTLEAYDPKASTNYPIWLKNADKDSKSSKPLDSKPEDEMDILDRAATAYLTSDNPDHQNVTDVQCVGFLFYLYAWMYSPQVFFKNLWNLLLNLSPSDKKIDCVLSLLLPELNSETRHYILANGLGIVSNNFNLKPLSKTDKIHPWPNMLLYGNVIYSRSAKLFTKAVSPSVEGLLLFVSTLFDDLWKRHLFPSAITQLSRLSYIGTQESLSAKDRVAKYLRQYIEVYDYKHLYGQLDLLIGFLTRLAGNLDEKYKDVVSERVAHEVLNNPASNWKHLVSTDILSYRCKTPSTFNEIFGTDVMSSSKHDSNLEFEALKSEFRARYLKDLSLVKGCLTLLEKARRFVGNLIVLQANVGELHKVYKLVDLFEKLQMSASVDYLLITLEAYCSDILYEKSFDEFINKLKELEN